MLNVYPWSPSRLARQRRAGAAWHDASKDKGVAFRPAGVCGVPGPRREWSTRGHPGSRSRSGRCRQGPRRQGSSRLASFQVGKRRCFWGGAWRRHGPYKKMRHEGQTTGWEGPRTLGGRGLIDTAVGSAGGRKWGLTTGALTGKLERDGLCVVASRGRSGLVSCRTRIYDDVVDRAQARTELPRWRPLHP